MSTIYWIAAVFLLANLAVGLVRIVLGPTEVDRMLSAQLFGTTGVAILLLMGQGLEDPALVDAALVFSLLAGIAAVVFVRRSRQPLRAARRRGGVR